jgi:hypothetical protein
MKCQIYGPSGNTLVFVKPATVIGWQQTIAWSRFAAERSDEAARSRPRRHPSP